jgi:hypothetical protein
VLACLHLGPATREPLARTINHRPHQQICLYKELASLALKQDQLAYRCREQHELPVIPCRLQKRCLASRVPSWLVQYRTRRDRTRHPLRRASQPTPMRLTHGPCGTRHCLLFLPDLNRNGPPRGPPGHLTRWRPRQTGRRTRAPSPKHRQSGCPRNIHLYQHLAGGPPTTISLIRKSDPSTPLGRQRVTSSTSS